MRLLLGDNIAVHVSHLLDTRKGNRPSFTEAAEPHLAEVLYERFCADVQVYEREQAP